MYIYIYVYIYVAANLELKILADWVGLGAELTHYASDLRLDALLARRQQPTQVQAVALGGREGHALVPQRVVKNVHALLLGDQAARYGRGGVGLTRGFFLLGPKAFSLGGGGVRGSAHVLERLLAAQDLTLQLYSSGAAEHSGRAPP